MLLGDRALLRSRLAADVAVLHAELYDDVVTRSRADTRPWTPVAADDAASPYAVRPPSLEVAVFSAVEVATRELAGEALLWGIDLHNRGAHVGVSLRPAMRGRGLGHDVVGLLCHYGFIVRGLHRLQIETLADNVAMRRVAEAVGFRHEATLRSSAWVGGAFVDEVTYGMVFDEWTRS